MFKYFFILFVLFLSSCNPVRHAEKQSDDLDNLVNRINAQKTIVINHDSTVYKSGAIIELRDTTRIPGRDSVIYINKYFYKTDSVKTYYENPKTAALLLSVSRDAERFKALYDASQESTKAEVKNLFFVVIALLVLIGLMIFLKFR